MGRMLLLLQLLAAFAVVLMLVVAFVAVVVAWTSEEAVTPTDLPMFTPLMWLAVGVFTGTFWGYDGGAFCIVRLTVLLCVFIHLGLHSLADLQRPVRRCWGSRRRPPTRCL